MAPRPKRPRRTGDVVARNTRFQEGGERRYNYFFSKPEIIAERDVDLSGLPPTFLQHMIDSRGWWPAFTGHVAPAIEIVREFYSNLYDANFVNKTCKVMLRGVTIDFSAEDISLFYKLPRVTNPTLPYKYQEELDMDTIALTLTGNKIRSYAKSFSPNDLTPEFRILNTIVAANILPLCPISRKFNIVRSWGLILYALRNGGEVDLANYIWRRIIDVATSPSTPLGLPFGSLITRFAAAKGLDILLEKRSEKGSLINIITWNLSLSRVAIPSSVQQEEAQPLEKDSGAHPCVEEEERPAIPTNVQREEQQPVEKGSGAGRSEEEEERPRPVPVPASDQSDLFALLASLGTQISGVQQRLDSVDVRLGTFSAHVGGELSYWKHHFGGGEGPAPPKPESSNFDLAARLESLGTQMTCLGTQLGGVHQYVRQMDSRLTQRLDLLEARLVTFTPRADAELLYQRYH